jgi:hypothetical protein
MTWVRAPWTAVENGRVGNGRAIARVDRSWETTRGSIQ